MDGRVNFKDTLALVAAMVWLERGGTTMWGDA